MGTYITGDSEEPNVGRSDHLGRTKEGKDGLGLSPRTVGTSIYHRRQLCINLSLTAKSSGVGSTGPALNLLYPTPTQSVF